MKASFSTTIMGCYTSENNCSGQWRRESTGHMYDILGLPDLVSDGSPLFAEPMFLFGWALRNTSVHVNLLTGLRELCSASLLHRPLQDIFTLALFWLPWINLSLQNLLPYCYYYFVFLKQQFTWAKVSYAMNVPLIFIIFFAKVKKRNTSFLSPKTGKQLFFLLSLFH